MKEGKGLLRTLLGKTSFLLILGLTLLFLYFNASQLYQQQSNQWQTIILGYLVTLALVIGIGLAVTPTTIRDLAKADYWSAFVLKFIPSFLATFLFLFLVKVIIKGSSSLNPLSFISYVPVYVIAIHALVIAQTEEIMNGVVFDAIKRKSGSKTANIFSIIMFSGFHLAKTGGSLIVMLTYVPLRYFWNILKENGYPGLRSIPKIGKYFQATPATNQSNAGSHFAWNLFILGFVNNV